MKITLSGEDALQHEILQMLKTSLIPGAIWFAVPNGGKRGIKVAMKMKATGQRAGVADLIIIHPETRVAHSLELKVGKNGLQKEQREYRDQCHAIGAPWAVARSRDGAQDILSDWGLIRITRFDRPVIEPDTNAPEIPDC